MKSSVVKRIPPGLVPVLHRLSMRLQQRDIDRCLGLQGGRSRPDKSFPFVAFVLDRFGVRGKTIADLGCGRGSFGFLLRRRYGPDFRLVGVELERAYFTPPTFLPEHYDEVIERDIREVDLDEIAPDVVLATDVLEHLEKEDAVALVKKVTGAGRLMIASVPIAEKHWVQYEEFERTNPLETHRHNWTPPEVEADLGLDYIGGYDAVGVFSNLRLLQ
jgi:2-polyprenyl-3-methyl-5-hydroxy-6-metoxy-1,4-benzoquinol methylase